MAKGLRQPLIFLLLVVSIQISVSVKLHSSQVETLVRIRSLLNFPSFLSSWNKKTSFCNLDPSPSVTVVCYGNNVTQLHIAGNKGAPKLPHNFSIESLVTALVKLPNLKVLTLVSLGLWGPLPARIGLLSSLERLNISSNFFYGNIPEEISSLTNLQGIVLDNNGFSGQLPDKMGSFPALNALSLRNNSFNGSLPKSVSKLGGLRVLTLANNHFYGDIPDLTGLENLEELDLENNSFGPDFPQLKNKLVTLIIRNNKFRSAIPAEISSYYQLQKLDISSNKFMGPFPVSLLSLPSINYLNIAGNKFTGLLSKIISCNGALNYVDLSSNLLTGDLPDCLQSNSKKQFVHYEGNCLNSVDNSQHPYSFCRNEALAAGIVDSHKKKDRTRRTVLASCIVGGVIVFVVFIILVVWLFKVVHAKKKLDARPPRVISEKASTGFTSKLLTDARYISKTMKLGALGIPAYRTFSLEELEIATNKFASAAFMGEGSQGQMYRGQLNDGSLVAIRCLKLKENHPIEYLMPHIELISKLRHHHLVSSIGHCFEYYLEDSSVSRLFLVFEYVPNGTLRSWISAGRARRKLTWSQRIAASIGIAKGIQFLHAGMTPGIFSNNLRITDILIDQNMAAKISSYNLPLLAENMGNISHAASTKSKEVHMRIEHEDKMDVYDFGVILLEMLMGMQIKTRSELNALRNQVQASLAADEAARRNSVAEEIQNTCSDESLKTLMEICGRCLSKDPSLRPSVEDVLWNLQFASQVQEAWQGGESRSSRGSSPGSPSPPPVSKLRFTIH
ncbi:probable inactive leucine-rich repeat receptor-like protein kinase At3g03770 [Beta vulgaris subsp. vulgaris]|uniref:probable inactive leucine-rich repeat receptor-like protein kinase At3g03770 n=1 Tax=Beta vulgaris subsp. vulgaris TaxID=3555 RepID=UPI0020370095|nr:probable inactive leucine-rich repeat receptor-like protein kinase At3g03770 [Beta vulgaris subsp. vulgaris]XP_010676346.2 probable inactive leucine-rich repeat receptor-like protein kinase At3g03770 [Beta vulgaris subsp. vulgaris]XP_010676347.2 probable inactive leucine-rich repeat receptor-like protein kinase At3g03770 [Beta vulgaris subsp. vulgaris]